MFAINKSLSSSASLLLTVIVLIFSQSALAAASGKGNDNGKGHNINLGVGNASDGIAGSVKTNKHVYYTGDSLEISLRFSRGSELIADGSADAYVVIFSPTAGSTEPSETDAETTPGMADAIVLPVSNVASADSHKLFELEAVDVGSLPAGTYQLGLILTNPGGDPLVINDWYRGLLGLVNIVGLTITDEAVDFDGDGDGEVDDDADGDGLSDDDSNDDNSSTSNTSNSPTGGTAT